MDAHTEKLWAMQNRHEGDRFRLFTTLADVIEADRVLYPGSFVDVAPSMVFPHVTYVDADKRFPKFFADSTGVREILDEHRGPNQSYDFRAIAGNYEDDLGLEPETFDLLVSLYAGFISEHCTSYLRIGGTLLVNPSHGDAALASIDDRYELTGVMLSRAGKYAFSSDNLDSYFVPKRDQDVTVERIHELGKGIGYTKSAFAYLFTRTS